MISISNFFKALPFWFFNEAMSTYDQSVRLLYSASINKFLIVLFLLSIRPLAFGWYALVTRWMTPVRRYNSAKTLLTNSRPWSSIWMKKQPWRFCGWEAGSYPHVHPPTFLYKFLDSSNIIRSYYKIELRHMHQIYFTKEPWENIRQKITLGDATLKWTLPKREI